MGWHGPRSFTAQYPARDIDIFAARILSLDHRLVETAAFAYRGEFNEHRQIDPCDDFDMRAVHNRNREIRGSAAKHIGEHDHARAAVDFGGSGNNILAPLFDIVIRANGNRFDLLLRTDHMFQRGAKFRGEAAMGHEDDSNHRTYLFIRNFVPDRHGAKCSLRQESSTDLRRTRCNPACRLPLGTLVSYQGPAKATRGAF